MRRPMITTERLATALSCLALLILVGATQPPRADDFAIVVSSSNPVETLSTTEASQFFLKRDTRWDGGATVEPVDQAGGPVRESFSERIHGKPVVDIKSFWQRQIFSGRSVPPAELSSDAEVLSFVRSHAWAIGYVSAGIPIGDGVKVVPLSD